MEMNLDEETSNIRHLKLNDAEMMKYYQQEFDPILYKYQNYFEDVLDGKDKDEYYFEKSVLIQKLTKHEQSKNFADLTKKDSEYILSNLKMIYGDEELAQYFVTMYHLIYTKVIRLYINIDGIERLFNDKYADFEWELHLGMNYDSHDMEYYRDHFIHQVKDAFTVDRLLNKFGYLKWSMDILREESNSKISAFVTKYINIQLERQDFFADKIKGQNDERKREYFLENIVKMSGYMAALFHDIGYPITANIKGNREIINYIFETYNLNDCNMNFNKITALLSNSLLFRVEPINRIRKRVEGNAEVGQKVDHGAVSAIVFLLHFYENGAIHRLEPYKICAVELAGLAIYNHTNQYKYISGKEKDYERNVYFQNPIAHLLRISDDLQEWGRIYFQISDQSNLIICNKCKTPILRQNDKDAYGKYKCHCKDIPEGIVFHRAFREEGFPYRRIFKVTICTDVRLERNEKIEYIELDYKLNRLLHIAYISPSYAQYRSKELKDLKKMFLRQKVPYTTYIKSFMSSNIIAIKSEIVGEFFLKNFLNNKENEIKTMLTRKEVLSQEELYSLLEKYMAFGQSIVARHTEFETALESVEDENTRQYLKRALKIYCNLYIAAFFVSMYNEKELEDKKDDKNQKSRKEIYTKLTEDYLNEFKKQNNLNFDTDISFLTNDYFRYAKHRFFHLEQYPYYPEDYFDEFTSDEELCVYVVSFCDSSKHQFEKFPEKGIDAYNDLYLFKILEMLQIEKD